MLLNLIPQVSYFVNVAMCQGPAERDVLTELAQGKLVAHAAAAPLEQTELEESIAKANAADVVSGKKEGSLKSRCILRAYSQDINFDLDNEDLLGDIDTQVCGKGWVNGKGSTHSSG